jgi:hypothetical protein
VVELALLERYQMNMCDDNDEKLRADLAVLDAVYALIDKVRAEEEEIQPAHPSGPSFQPIYAISAISSGDILRHRAGTDSYVVTGNYGGRVTAVRTVDVTNPDEWLVLRGR